VPSSFCKKIVVKMQQDLLGIGNGNFSTSAMEENQPQKER
jgi:hypothetical protein